MNKNILREVTDYLTSHRHRQIWKKVVSVLACIVVFCTTYALILPAITLEKAPQCGKEEHVHNEACYTGTAAEEEIVPVCTLESLNLHEHTEVCLGEDGEYVCGYRDFVVHQHDTSCFDADGNLWCPLPEVKAHIHNESCFDENDNLICEQAQVPEHQHSDTCFWTEENTTDSGTLTCQMEEHTHTEDCFLRDGLTEEQWAQIDEVNALISVLPEADEVKAALEARQTSEDWDGMESYCAQLQEQCASAQTAYDALSEKQKPHIANFERLTNLTELFGAALLALPVEDKLVEEGELEGGLHWKMTKNDGDELILTISGTGPMPNYLNQPGKYPWAAYDNFHVVIGDGVTTVGGSAFQNKTLRSVTLGKNVSELRTFSFAYTRGLEHITIPGNVKDIQDRAFYLSSVKSIELQEGVETVCPSALNTTQSCEICLPASIRSFDPQAARKVTAFRVNENNPLYYSDENGVLYKWNDENKNDATLVAYPVEGVAYSFTVPENVTAIGDSAFQYSVTLKEAVIPNTVKTVGRFAFANSGIEKVTIGNQVQMDAFKTFIYCDSLREVTLPDTLTEIHQSLLSYCNSLQKFTVKPGVTKVAQCLVECNALQEVYFDARDCKELNPGYSSDGYPRFVLTIGRNVDFLRGANDGYPGFATFASHADIVCFEGPNRLTVEPGALTGAPTPYNALSGEIYVDSQGVIYQIDNENHTARLCYVPEGVTDLTVPTAISTEADEDYTVTAVGENALAQAKLESITFAAPGSIRLDAYALANCPTLKSVNRKTTVEEARALFPSEAIGYQAFYNTGLIGAEGGGSFETDMNGKKSLQVVKDGFNELDIGVESKGGTMEWVNQNGEAGGYRLLTGDTLTFTAAVGNTEGNTDGVYRIYLRRTGPEGSLSVEPGESYTFNGQMAVCHTTEDPLTVYLEFSPQIGKTVSIPVTVVYPSPNSSGGGLTVWGNILTKEEATASENRLLASENGTIQAFWTTKPDTFQMIKSGLNPATLSVVSDGAGGATLHSSLNWQIALSRENAVSNSYGKDYAKSVDVTDRMTLPEGLSWKAEVISDIKSGAVRRSGAELFAGDLKIASLSRSVGTCSVTDFNIAWDEESNQAILSWRLRSASASAEMNASKVNLNVYPQALTVDMTKIDTSKTYTIDNRADARVHFHYSEDQVLDSSAQKTFSGGKGTLKVKKAANDVRYFGEDLTYDLEVYNEGGLPWTGNQKGVYTLRDAMSEYLCIKPENIQRMFEDEYGGQLTVKIENATLGVWQRVIGVDGTTDSWQTPGNSNLGVGGYTLLLTKTAQGQYSAAVEGGETYTAETVAVALQKAGYSVTGLAKYTCFWALNSENEVCKLDGGEHRGFSIYATVKDSFQMLSRDWQNEYPSDSPLSFQNGASVMKPDKNAAVNSNKVTSSVKREARINKRVFKDGQLLTEKPNAKTGEILEYQLDFTHYGAGGYRNLPMVDDLYGSQYLLVPVSGNPGLTELKKTTYNGAEYYILKEGSYQNVMVGVDDEGKAMTAAAVTVTKADEETHITLGGQEQSYSGLHTKIKWYFHEMESGDYRKTVTYQTMADTSLTGLTSTFGNVVWMNDRTDNRIYDSLWGGGTIIDFEKHIVTERGETPAQDQLDEDGYSLVCVGEQVTYRLTLHNSGGDSFTLKGNELADALPETADIFQWEKGTNITGFHVETVGQGVTTSGLENWYLGRNYMSLLGDRQYILWPEDAQITFTGPSTVYLYFTLTYPGNTGTEDTWSQYAAALGGGSINNTMYVYRFPSAVLHDLKEPGQALLQKGVQGMYYFDQNNSYRVAGSSREFYSNKDIKSRAVLYYVTLYNGGSKRLYLNDLQDKLPRGFTYQTLLADESLSKIPPSQYQAVITLGGMEMGTSPLASLGSEAITYRSARIAAHTTVNGVTFSFGSGSGDYAVHFDEDRGQYYLDQGEAIVFGYLCDIGSEADTSPRAINVIAMPYTDQPETGITTISKHSLLVTAPEDSRFIDYNDGSRVTKSAVEVSNDYGFESSGGEETWLVSDVTVRRGRVIPGVTKYTDSHTNPVSHQTTPYTNSVSPTDTVNWRVRLHNSGTQAITDYTFTDVMPKPYVFEGEIVWKFYDGNGNLLREETLIRFPAQRTGEETELKIYYPLTGREYPLKTDGTPLKLNDDIIILNKDKNGNEVLQITRENANVSIMEGGYVDVCLSSRNPTNGYNNTVYTNRALLTPNRQEFSVVEQGSMLKDQTGKPVSVINSSPVTVSFGYATSSEKRVTQKDNVSNTGVSTDLEHNAILLPAADSPFFYTLTVDNATDHAMTKLVLIDNLPQVGDHSPFHTDAPRNSAFTVSLAENPQFEITVTPPNGEAYTLDQQYYTVEYAVTQDFGGPQSADWKGETTGTTANWTRNSAGARAFRIVIRDETGMQLPAKAKISVTFHAKVEGKAPSAAIAWNSFGYDYVLKDVQGAELEAMPLEVGVQVPSVPMLEKKLVDTELAPVAAQKDESFTFLVHEGEALPEESYRTESDWKTALKDRKYQIFSVTVNSGSSSSGSTPLESEGWTWFDGKTYTIAELDDNKGYEFRSFSGSSSGTYTFTYRAASRLEVVCENTLRQWKLSLTKIDKADQKALAGAVFALYSPAEADMLENIPEKYRELARETVQMGEKTWYLKDIRETGTDGRMEWEKLTEEEYYLLEAKAPEGYLLEGIPGQIVYRDNAVEGAVSLKVENRKGYELPESGGAGTGLYTRGGLLLTAAAMLLLYKKNKRRKERKS